MYTVCYAMVLPYKYVHTCINSVSANKAIPARLQTVVLIDWQVEYYTISIICVIHCSLYRWWYNVLHLHVHGVSPIEYWFFIS